jgi:MFS family permease
MNSAGGVTAGRPSDSISPTVKGLSVVSLLNDFASEMVYPLLPAFVTGTLGGGAFTLAALDGTADLVAAATKWWSGNKADRPGWSRPLILVGYVVATIARPAIALAGAGWQVVGLRAADRLGKGARTPPRDAMIAAVTPPAIRGRAFGFHRAADHFGSIPGALLAWWLLSLAVPTRSVLALSLVPGLLSLIVLIAVLRSARNTAATPASLATAPPDATGTVFWAPVTVLAMLVLCRMPEALLLLRLQDLGVATAMIPLVWAGLHVIRSVVSYPGGWLTDRLGPRRLVTAGGLAFAVGAAALASAVSTAGGVGVFLGLGLVAGLMEPAERSLVARLAPRRTGRGFGAYYALTGFAALPAALLFGAIYQRQGGGAALYLSAFLMVVATVCWWPAMGPDSERGHP